MIGSVWRYESRWGRVGHCVLLQCNGGFMKALCCSILGKLDLGWGILAFLNSCADRRGCWNIPALPKFITSCCSFKDNGVGLVNHLSNVWFKSLTWPHSLSRLLLLKADIRGECLHATLSCGNTVLLSQDKIVSSRTWMERFNNVNVLNGHWKTAKKQCIRPSEYERFYLKAPLSKLFWHLVGSLQTTLMLVPLQVSWKTRNGLILFFSHEQVTALKTTNTFKIGLEFLFKTYRNSFHGAVAVMFT